MLDDETLRDGLQSPSVRTPTIDEKIELLHHMDGLGIDTADIGLPGAGARVARDVERLARAIADGRMRIRANCAARTMVADIKPIAEIQQRTGVPIECGAFVGSSPVRQYAEGWEPDYLPSAPKGPSPSRSSRASR
jgi:2-isopropylmalate synthase